MTTVGRGRAPQALAGSAADGDAPLQIRVVTSEDILALAGAAIGSLGLTWVIYERLMPWSGGFGFWVCWYLVFLVLYLAVAGFQWNRLVVRDKTMAVLVSTGGLLACAVVFEQLGLQPREGPGRDQARQLLDPDDAERRARQLAQRRRHRARRGRLA